MTLARTVLDILDANIQPGSRLAQADYADRPRMAVDNATPESLRGFIEIYEALSGLIHPDNVKTRNVEQTWRESYGVHYFTRPIPDFGRARGNQIQANLLPTRPELSGYLVVYFVGHMTLPVEAEDSGQTGETKAECPVFWAVNRPTATFVSGVIDAFSRSVLFDNIE